MSELKSVLIITDNESLMDLTKEAFDESLYRVITAQNPNEARLKFANESFNLVVCDHHIKGLRMYEFIENTRRKEILKNAHDHVLFLVMVAEPELFQEHYSEFDHCKFIELPFTLLDLKKKLLSFTGNNDVISENTKKISKNEYLITEGGASHEMYWIISGKFLITKLNSDNQNVIIGEVYPGELVGEMSFLDNLTRSASVMALEDSEVLSIPHNKFLAVLESQPRWFRSLMRTLSQRLRNANQMISRKTVEITNHDIKSTEVEKLKEKQKITGL